MSIETACFILGVSRSGYYKHKRCKSYDNSLYNLIKQIYNKSKGRYGYRRVHDVLIKEYNLSINHKKVLRIMQELGLKSKIRVRRKYFGASDNLFANNTLNRSFFSDLPKKN